MRAAGDSLGSAANAAYRNARWAFMPLALVGGMASMPLAHADSSTAHESSNLRVAQAEIDQAKQGLDSLVQGCQVGYPEYTQLYGIGTEALERALGPELTKEIFGSTTIPGSVTSNVVDLKTGMAAYLAEKKAGTRSPWVLKSEFTTGKRSGVQVRVGVPVDGTVSVPGMLISPAGVQGEPITGASAVNKDGVITDRKIAMAYLDAVCKAAIEQGNAYFTLVKNGVDRSGHVRPGPRAGFPIPLGGANLGNPYSKGESTGLVAKGAMTPETYLDVGSTVFNAFFGTKLDLASLAEHGITVLDASSSAPGVTFDLEGKTLAVYGVVTNDAMKSADASMIFPPGVFRSVRAQGTVGFEVGEMTVQDAQGRLGVVPVTVDVDRDAGIGAFDTIIPGTSVDTRYKVKDATAVLSGLAPILQEYGFVISTKAQGGTRGPYPAARWEHDIANVDVASFMLDPLGETGQPTVVVEYSSGGENYALRLLGPKDPKQAAVAYTAMTNAIRSLVPDPADSAPISFGPATARAYLGE